MRHNFMPRTKCWRELANSCCSCGASTLGTYKTGIRKLGHAHMARPAWGRYKVVKQVVCDTIHDKKGSNAVKTILNAAAMVYTMGIVRDPFPKRLWKALKACQHWEE